MAVDHAHPRASAVLQVVMQNAAVHQANVYPKVCHEFAAAVRLGHTRAQRAQRSSTNKATAQYALSSRIDHPN
jgi:hypothetical protein